MKALEWRNFFTDQKALHGKLIFSVAELANAAHTSLHALNTELGRLLKRGIVCRYAQGRYWPAQGVAPEKILPAIDPGAYITGFYALFLHGLVTQAPSEITCFTNRRHNRKSNRLTPAGTLRFISVPASVYARPPDAGPASAEQALSDFTWLNLRAGADPRSLVTFRNLDTLNRRRMATILRRYPETVGSAACRIVGAATT